ncbi:MAG: LAGLIDADG family homing endonuclease [Candidatus Aenigmatarchaeota archaeon]
MVARIEKLEMQGFKSFAKRTHIVFPRNFNCICGPNGSGKCLVGSARLTLSDGRQRKIGDVVEEALGAAGKVERLDDGFMTAENPQNVRILTLNLETLKVDGSPVSAFVKRRYGKRMKMLTTRSGKKLTVTGTHPFFTVREGAIKSVPAMRLTVGEKVAVPRVLPIKSGEDETGLMGSVKASDNIYVPFSADLKARVVDHLKKSGRTQKGLCRSADVPYTALKGLMDGQAINAANLIKLLRACGSTDEEIAALLGLIKGKTARKAVKIPSRLDENLARFLGYMISEGSSSASSDQLRFVCGDAAMNEDFSSLSSSVFGVPAARGSYKPGADDFMIYSAPLQKYLGSTFGFKIGTDSAHKSVPDQVFSAPDGVVANFLAGAFDGDGYLQPDGNYFEYSTASRDLADGMTVLLLRLGLPSVLKRKLKSAQNGKLGTYWSVYVYGHGNLLRLTDNIPFRNARKVAAVERIRSKAVKGNPNVDLIPDINGVIKTLVRLCGVKIKPLRKACPKLAAYYEGRCECSRDGLAEVLDVMEKNGRSGKDAKRMIKYLRVLAESDIFWDEIVKIEETQGEDWVYDLCVEGHHNFIAENFIVHNSNVLDAIVFVLGRTSAKSIRADKMLEVIYNGGQKAGPAEFAKVTIAFDNKDKKFPLEEESVVISRQVSRRGVSIYKLGGKTVTREKVLEVLRAAHVHPDGHNIILQGDITEVIEMSPTERREIIDEISGISEFNEKRDKAAKELMTVEERLKESGIILNERQGLLNRLEDEAKSAETYNELATELDRLRASLARRRLSEAEEAMSELQRKIESKEADTSMGDAELVKLDTELGGFEQRLQRIQQRLIDRSTDIAVIKEAEGIRSQIFAKKAKAESNEFEIARLGDMIQKIEQLRQAQLEHASGAVQAVLKLGWTGVYGTVGTLVKVPSQYQTAIDVAAGNHIHDVVVDTAETAVNCVKHLKSNRIGRATFLPLDKVRERNSAHLKKFQGNPGVVGIALDLITFNQKYWHAFSHVFGDTLVVDTIDTAKSLGIGEARYVTLDGDMVERSGAIIGGFYRSEKHALPQFEDVGKYEEQKKRLQAEIAELRHEAAGLQSRFEELTKEQVKGGEELQHFQKERMEVQNQLDAAREKRKVLGEHKFAAGDEVQKLKISRARLEAELENLKSEFSQTRQELATYELAPSTLQGKIRDSITRIQALGPINQKAIEEFRQLKVVYDELKGKVDVLSSERDRILQIIADIEGRRKETFMTTLTAVSAQFKRIFHELLGGEGSLRLDGEPLEEAGLAIEACPPGRKVMNIDAMSGGEKTMTALAFLFAIQTFRPAPFYILDEIDAALDKPNTKKMTEFIKLNSEKAEFIVISHNDTTIQAADCVYGVSMEEGESKLVGIKMPE